MTRTLTLLLVVSLFAGCTSDPSYQSVSPDTDFVLKPGGRAEVDDRFTIRFDSVAEDSRCPAGANCAWEGNASAVMEYQSPDHPPTSLTLNTSGHYLRDTIIQSYRIRLVEVLPGAELNKYIVPSQYSVKLRVERP